METKLFFTETKRKIFRLPYRLIMLLVLFNFTTTNIFGQVQGDYQSKVAVGNWNSSSTWQVYNGSTWVDVTSGYPGVTTVPAGSTTSTVTIKACHDITINPGWNNNFTYQNIKKLVINGRMNLTKKNDVRFSNTLGEVVIDGGSINWADSPANLYLPQGCNLTFLNLDSTTCSFPK